MSNGIGYDRETTLNRMKALLDEKIQISKTMDEKGYLKKPLIRNAPEQMVLQAKLDELQQAINETRDYYTVHLLESLETSSKELNAETKKLSGLTRWLISLTSVLAILTLVLVIRTLMG